MNLNTIYEACTTPGWHGIILQMNSTFKARLQVSCTK
jgi:hypothetical protein